MITFTRMAHTYHSLHSLSMEEKYIGIQDGSPGAIFLLFGVLLKRARQRTLDSPLSLFLSQGALSAL